MKKMLILLFVILLSTISFAQSPMAFKYQVVVRDGTGIILPNRNVTFRISILQSGPTGTSVYSELHAKTSNSFGLVDLEIGNGSSPSGSFSGINWGNGTYFVKVEIDPAGGIAFQQMGTSQLLSVPYSLYAKNVQNNNDADADSTNEIQVLSIAGSNLSLSRKGGTVTIPGDNWGTQVVVPDVTLTGKGTAASPLGIAPQGALAGNFLGWNGLKWTPMPEAQKLSLTGNNLSIAGGNSVALPQCPWTINGGNIYFDTGNVGIGLQNPATFLHVGDATGMSSPQFKIDNTSPGLKGNASVGFGVSALRTNYAMGMDGSSGEFKLIKYPSLLSSSQNDGITMIKTTSAGITSFNNQSRSRVYQFAGILLIFQSIPALIWQPVEFNMVTYDTQNEWTTAGIGSNPVGGTLPRGTSYFTAKEEGYYQVNARADFILNLTDVPNKYIQNDGHVSIAIFVSSQGAAAAMYSQGNKLQGVHWMQVLQQYVELPVNLAPNVSDVVYLKAGDSIEIRVYQSIMQMMLLNHGPYVTYVSVHKVS